MTIIIRGSLLTFLSAALALSARGVDFSATSSLPDSYHQHGLTHHNGFAFHLGGLSGSVGISGARKTFAAPVNADGTLGAWTPGPDLPQRVFAHASVAAAGHLYVIGGQQFTAGVGVGPSNKVYYAPVSSAGVIGAWNETSPLPLPVFFLNAAHWNGRLYAMGGFKGDGLSAGVHSAALNADGTLSAWRAESSLPEAVYTHAAVAENTVYVLGGIVNDGTEVRSTVLFAQIGADGVLGPWLETSPLPEPLANLGSIVTAGTVFVVGGFNGSETSSKAYSAPILADKTLGEWTVYGHLPAGRHRHGTTHDGKHMYVSGGINSTPRSDVFFAALPQPPPSRLAALVDLDPDVLNLWSMGRYVKARVAFLPSMANVADIDPASVRVAAVNGTDVPDLHAEPRRPRRPHDWWKRWRDRGCDKPHKKKGSGEECDEETERWDDDDDGSWSGKQPKVSDSNGDGILDMTLHFDRQDFARLLAVGDNAVELEGRLRDGRSFSGVGRIWANRPGKKHKHWVKRQVRELGIALGSKAGFASVTRAGGDVRGGRVAVRLPDGALSGMLNVVVLEAPPLEPAEKSTREKSAEELGLKAIGEGAEFGPHGARFDKPVTIELPYEPATLPAGASERELSVHYWNHGSRDWEPMPSIVDTVAKVVRAQTTHFSHYQVMAGAGPAASASVTQVYAFPNPARAGQRPTLRVEGANASKVEIRVYDLTGALRHSAEYASPSLPLEHAWDAAGAGSGVYPWVVTVHGSDGSRERRRGRLAVIR